jgi:hypothetical protein
MYKTGLSEDLPVLDKNSEFMRDFVDNYKSLRSTVLHLTKEANDQEKRLRDICSTLDHTHSILNNTYNSLGSTHILSLEEMLKYEEKKKDLQDYQNELRKKIVTAMKEELLRTNKQLEVAQTNLVSYRDFVVTGVKEMVGPDVKINTCTICLENEVTNCLVPCGHTFCEGCIKKSDTGGTSRIKCMTCRTSTDKVVKLYFN